MVTGAGLEFRLLRGDPEPGNTSEGGRRWHAGGTGPLGQARMVRVLQNYVDSVSEDFIAAVRAGTDFVLLNTVALFTGYDVCEGLGVPSAGAFPSPVHPTGDLPPAALGLPSLGRTVNRALDRVAPPQARSRSAGPPADCALGSAFPTCGPPRCGPGCRLRDGRRSTASAAPSCRGSATGRRLHR